MKIVTLFLVRYARKDGHRILVKLGTMSLESAITTINNSNNEYEIK